ncbi:MAG: PEGA domain-containing protein [Candidatus Latescibacterota bacterium]|nr:MAG: PEGA domain-containing protein [Candidatus Latescibacterota bacterium]
MLFEDVRTCVFSKILTLVTILAFAVVIVLPSPLPSQTAADEQKEEVYKKFEEIVTLRADGEYDRAIEKLTEITEEYTASDVVLRQAYHHLVQTYHQKGDDLGARTSARSALERFPDLKADEVLFPSYVNDYYDQLRREMFGSLMIEEPEGCRVYLNDKHVGETPLTLELVRVGEYNLTVTKSGYVDYTDTIQIKPERMLQTEPPLKRERGWKWWAYRVGAGVVAVGLLALGLAGLGDEQPPPESEPLPEPPDPPAN